MKIVIFGSSGETGKALVRQALQRGHEVYAFARRPGEIGIGDPRLHPLEGDVLDEASVRRAAEGMDAAVSVLGVRMGQPPSTVRSTGTANIVAALTAAGVRRFVSCSTVGAGGHLQTLPWLTRMMLPRIIGAWRLEEAGRQEDIVRSSGLDWTVLRPPRLVDGPLTGKYRIGEDLVAGFGAKLTRGNLATAMLDQLESERFLRRLPIVLD